MTDEMKYPASAPDVIGVTGASKSGVKACFASCGDAAAASGNGLFGNCDVLDQEDAIISVLSSVGNNLPSTTAKFEYWKWAGTSFAAAIVGGVAARELSQWTSDGCLPNLASDYQSTFATVLSQRMPKAAYRRLRFHQRDRRLP